MHWRAQEQIERTGHHAFGGIFHADHAELRRASRRGMEDFIKAVAVHQIDGAAKVFNGRLFAKRALRA